MIAKLYIEKKPDSMAHSLSKSRIRIALLEGISPAAAEVLRDAGYENVTRYDQALDDQSLLDALADVHFVGIRSRTQMNARILKQLPRLAGIGCFCIGTNQVDLDTARMHGIPVFNAPFSNTRSVAELVLAEMILLMRRIPEKNAAAHRGEWQKSAKEAYEIRGKRLGIVGYGHIGTQLGILAESLGMQVQYFDIENKLPLGNAVASGELQALLASSDVVSLHVPQTPATEWMIGTKELQQMSKGSILINASRGQVVDIDALAHSLKTGHLAGAAVDVYPTEPGSNQESFTSPLQAFDNTILTPHIGGSTEEAQVNIAREVAGKLVRYSDNGSTESAVNFPQVSLPDHGEASRILHIHANKPGILEQINRLFAQSKTNVLGQYLQTDADVGYVVMDVASDSTKALLEDLKSIEGTIRARILY